MKINSFISVVPPTDKSTYTKVSCKSTPVVDISDYDILVYSDLFRSYTYLQHYMVKLLTFYLLLQTCSLQKQKAMKVLMPIVTDLPYRLTSLLQGT